MKQFRGGLVFKAQRLLYHSTLGLRVIKKKKGFVMAWEKKAASPQGFMSAPKVPRFFFFFITLEPRVE